MADIKTKQHDDSVKLLLQSIEDNQRYADCMAVCELMQELTGETAKMRGSSIVGFGTYRYVYDSARVGAWFLTGFSPRKRNITTYIMTRLQQFPDYMSKLGKYKPENSDCI